MKKMIKIILIILLVLIIVLIGAFIILKQITKNNIMDGPGMIREINLTKVEYSESGDSLGSTYNLTAILKENNKAEIILETSPSHNVKVKTKKYKVSEKLFEDLRELINYTDYDNWKNLDQKEEFALDASISTISITVDNKNYSVNEYKKLPEKEENIIRDVRKTILSYIGDNNE